MLIRSDEIKFSLLSRERLLTAELFFPIMEIHDNQLNLSTFIAILHNIVYHPVPIFIRPVLFLPYVIRISKEGYEMTTAAVTVEICSIFTQYWH